MKVNMSVEATAREMREFFGLPDVKPVQDEMMKMISSNMPQGFAPGTDYTSLMRPFFSFQAEGLETMQKAFWNAFSHGMQQSDEDDNQQESSTDLSKPDAR